MPDHQWCTPTHIFIHTYEQFIASSNTPFGFVLYGVKKCENKNTDIRKVFKGITDRLYLVAWKHWQQSVGTQRGCHGWCRLCGRCFPGSTPHAYPYLCQVLGDAIWPGHLHIPPALADSHTCSHSPLYQTHRETKQSEMSSISYYIVPCLSTSNPNDK